MGQSPTQADAMRHDPAQVLRSKPGWREAIAR